LHTAWNEAAFQVAATVTKYYERLLFDCERSTVATTALKAHAHHHRHHHFRHHMGLFSSEITYIVSGGVSNSTHSLANMLPFQLLFP